jgi:Arc/MetJ-type ribon-helix-helix transcriptional regulator
VDAPAVGGVAGGVDVRRRGAWWRLHPSASGPTIAKCEAKEVDHECAPIERSRERLILRQLESGRYRSAEDVIDKAVPALDSQEQEFEERAYRFKAGIEERLKQPATPLDFAAIMSKVKRGLRRARPDSVGNLCSSPRASLLLSGT